MLKKLVKIILATYFVVLLAIVCFQRKFIFLPPYSGTQTPADFNLNYQTHKIKTADNLNLSAWFVEAQSDSYVLLYCHGNGANLSALAHVTPVFHDLNLSALIFDYRNYGDSDRGALSEANLAIDAQAAYDWLIARGVPAQKIIIWGHSLGSSVAANLARHNKAAGLIIEGAFTSMYEMSQQRFPWLLIMPFMIFDKFETQKYLQERKMHLLQIHAENDQVIPIAYGQKSFATAAEPKTWLLVKDVGHNDFPSVYPIYKSRILEFIKGLS